MKFKISFSGNGGDKRQEEALSAKDTDTAPRKSVVRVQFPGWGTALAYYNDRFDLHTGDFVYVDGKFEGRLGRVTDVNYNFKIKLSEYQRVIALVDTSVCGQFHYAGSYLLTFDRGAIPTSKVASWFMAPAKEEDEFVSGSDDTSFRLDDLSTMKISPIIAERGLDYYTGNNVVYLSIDGTRGYAIVEGSNAYEVEFEYQNGEISRLTCTCFCSYNCKHEYAAMLQLKEMLERIEKSHAEEYERAGYFAAIFKETLFTFAVNGHDMGSFTLE